MFSEAGVESATMEMIAARAGTSIGSIYQFFPNKAALFEAVAGRYLESSRRIFERFMTPDARVRPWREQLERSIHAFSALDREDPDFRAVWRNWHLSRDFIAAGQALNRQFAEGVELVLAEHAPGIPRSRRRLVAELVVETITAMNFLAVRSTDREARRIIAESKVLLGRYLEPYTLEGREGKPPGARPSGRSQARSRARRAGSS